MVGSMADNAFPCIHCVDHDTVCSVGDIHLCGDMA